MKNRKFAIISDSILVFILCSFISLILLSYLRERFYLKLTLSFIFSFCVSAMIFIHKLRKYKFELVKSRDQKKLENMLNSLEIMPDNEVIDLLFNFLKTAGIKLKNKSYPLQSENFFYLFNFEKSTSRHFITKLIKEYKNKRVLLFCNSLADDSKQLVNTFSHKITVVNGETLFSLMKKYNFEFNDDKEQVKVKRTEKLKQFLQKIFTKKRALSFAFIALTVLIFSYFTFFPIYYKIFACFSLFLSLLCLFLGKKEPRPSEDPLIENQ